MHLLKTWTPAVDGRGDGITRYSKTVCMCAMLEGNGRIAYGIVLEMYLYLWTLYGGFDIKLLRTSTGKLGLGGAWAARFGALTVHCHCTCCCHCHLFLQDAYSGKLALVHSPLIWNHTPEFRIMQSHFTIHNSYVWTLISHDVILNS